MQNIYLRSFKPAAFGISLLTLLLSFTNAKAGGEHFSIYLNKKLVETQFVNASKTNIINLQIKQLAAGDELSIFYDHCGKVGKERTIAIKDEKNKTIKEWKFDDVADKSTGMNISANEILALKKKYPGTALNIYYSSKELPQGRKLASINTGDKNSVFNSKRATLVFPVLAACFLTLTAFYKLG